MWPRSKAACGSRRSTRRASLRRLLALALMVTLLLIAVPVTTAVPMDRSVVLHSCAIAKYAARCGALMVPEDRLTGTGREIRVRVVVVPASGPGRLADPIVWVAGGPGDSAVDMIQRVMPLFFFNTHRDLVFVDQRGTGGASARPARRFIQPCPT